MNAEIVDEIMKAIEERSESEDEKPVVDNTVQVKCKRGRKPKYHTEEEKKQVQREQALRWYYRNKAKKEAMKNINVSELAKETDHVNIKFETPEDSKLGKESKVTIYKIIGGSLALKAVHEFDKN